MCGNNNCDSLREVLCTIVKIQKKVDCIEGVIASCDRPFLGQTPNSLYNTRPISFYTCPTNTLWTMPYTLNGTTGTSSVFRVERVNDETATLRVLAPNPDTTSVFPYVSTDSFIIVNCSCVCAIQCLTDTFVDNV